jgi:thiamine-phosphate pyrophosphorylase
MRVPVIMMVTAGACRPGDDAADAALARRAGVAARAGVDAIQLREPRLEGGELRRVAEAVLGAAAGTGARVLVNRRIDVALVAGAHGVHLPARGADPRRVRAIVPPGFLIGRSAHSAGEVAALDRDECDYLVFGTVYASASKPAGHAVAGLAGLRAACAAARAPVLAIGGVSADRAAELAAAGASGAAAIRLFADIDLTDEDAAARRLRVAIDALRAPFSAAAPSDR